MSKLDDLTIGEAKQLAVMFGKESPVTKSLNDFVGQKVIIRTYSAGVWFGKIDEKSGNEVIVSNARRLWYWKAKQSISLSAVAQYGISSQSKIAPSVPYVWLEAIELIPTTKEATKSIEGAEDAKTQ